MTEENNCKFISSMGFRKSCDFFSLDNSVNYFNTLNYDNIKEGYLIYIKTDYLKKFIINIDKLQNHIYIFCGSSDYTIPNDVITLEEFNLLLNNKYIINFYAENCIYKHKKIINLPIGLDYHTMTKYKIYWGSIKTPYEQEQELVEIRNIMKPFNERQLKIYSNCHFFVNSKFGNDRTEAIKIIPNNLLFLEIKKIDRKTSWNNQINYSFVLSPHGNGLDCHRTWEALVLGCIPIVKKSPIDDLYIDLPVLIVNNWNEINYDLLKNTIKIFSNIQFNYKKLELNYWINNIRNIL
jgi:hypothetical protein